MSEEAIEAATRAIVSIAWSDGEVEPLNAHDDAEQLATAAINAYLAARKEAGFVEVQVDE